jgi:peptide/nickel transport system substrate-binding protein
MNRHCERSEAIQYFGEGRGKKTGLLRRCAPRNDGEGCAPRNDVVGKMIRYFSHRRRRLDCFAALAMTVLLGTAPAHAADPENCGTIIVPPGVGLGPGADITSFNPDLITSAYNGEAAGLLFMPLIWINRFHTIDFSRSIARAVTTPDNGKTYDVTLRNWHWSDGVPVTTQDILYAFNLIKSLGSTYPGYGAGGMPDIIASLTAGDATHFTVVLKRQVNPDWFILDGLSQLEPFPAHVWGRYTLDQIWQNQSSPAFFQVVDGPLIIKRLVVGVDAEFLPNPAYEGPKMHFDRFIMKFENSEGQELQAVESGDLDMSNVPFDLFDKARHLPGTYVVTLPPSYSWHQLIPNMANPATGFFADVRVRDAMQDAINQKEIVQLAMHGLGVPVYGPVPPYPDTFLSPAAKAGNYPVGYDPAKARALLAAAGWAPGPDGIMQKGGAKLSFTAMIPAGQPLRIEMAESIQQNLRKVGIDMQTHQVELNQIFALTTGQPLAWEAALYANDMSAYPSGESIFSTGAFYNDNGYSDPTMDRYIAASTDKPGLAGLFAYETYASAQEPVIFLPVEQNAVLARDGIHGLQDFMSPMDNWSPEQLYCTAPAA